MLKRSIAFLTVCLLFTPMLIFVAHADVIVEPQNDFFFAHRNDCVYVGRSFYVNSESGSVSLKKEPGSNYEVSVCENSEVLYISHTYDYNGEIWGAAEIYDEKSRWVYGWVQMNQLTPVYDYISFAEDHQNEFSPYTGNYEELSTAEQIVAWTYPCSGNISGTFTHNINDYIKDLKDSVFTPQVYKDEQGREWVYVFNSYWICLSEPGNENIPAAISSDQTNNWQTDYTAAPQPEDKEFSMILLIIILIFVLITGTAVLIRIFWKPNRGN